MALRAGRIAKKETELDAVRQEGRALVPGDEDAVDDAARAEAIGVAAAGGCVEVGSEVEREGAKVCAPGRPVQ